MEEEQPKNELFEDAQLAGAIGQGAQAAAAAGYYMQEQEKGLAETQLDVEAIIAEIYHLLKQDKKVMKEGKISWDDISNESDRVLTEVGVERIMQLVNFYVNKNTLLSNFDTPQIDRIMLRFCTELNDLILLKYQTLFVVPNFEECKKILQERIKEKAKLREFSSEILGTKINVKNVEEQMFKEIEFKIEKEIEKIKIESRKEKLREYGLMMAQLEVMIYSTLNRAYRGEERGSIRRHTNISEIIGNHPQPQKNNGGMFGWLNKS